MLLLWFLLHSMAWWGRPVCRAAVMRAASTSPTGERTADQMARAKACLAVGESTTRGLALPDTLVVVTAAVEGVGVATGAVATTESRKNNGSGSSTCRDVLGVMTTRRKTWELFCPNNKMLPCGRQAHFVPG